MESPTLAIRETEKFVEAYMDKYDPSHDFHHVKRVVRQGIRVIPLYRCYQKLCLTALPIYTHSFEASKGRSQISQQPQRRL